LLHPGRDLSDEVRTEIAAELNVKVLEDVVDLTDLESWTVLPNFRALGPRLGPRVNDVKAALAAMDGAEVRRHLASEGYVTVAGERLGPDDVEVRADRHEDFALVQDDGWAVALDLDIDDELRREGAARQLARAVNDLRKSEGLDLTDRIILHLRLGGPVTAAAVDSHRDWIAAETLAVEIVTGSEPLRGGHTVEIAGERVDLAIERT
jgi:isoleucyl-tRNA synthetase